MDDNIVDHHPTVLAAPTRGSDELLESLKTSIQLFDTVTYEQIGGGIVNMDRGYLTGDWVFDAKEIKARSAINGTWIKFHMTGVYKIENKKIVEVHNYGNILDIYRQMGYELVAPSDDGK